MTFDHVLVDFGRQVWGGEGAGDGDGDGDYGGWWWVLNVGVRGGDGSVAGWVDHSQG